MYVLPPNARQVSGRFPRTAGPNEILYRLDPATGQISSYQVYDNNGLPIKRVDLLGAPHSTTPVPHVLEFVHDVNPTTGQVFPRPDAVRPALPDEIP